MIHQHSLQTAAAFDRIDDALMGKTEDNLSKLVEELQLLLYKAKQIKDTTASFVDGSDYDPQNYCNIPTKF